MLQLSYTLPVPGVGERKCAEGSLSGQKEFLDRGQFTLVQQAQLDLPLQVRSAGIAISLLASIHETYCLVLKVLSPC